MTEFDSRQSQSRARQRSNESYVVSTPKSAKQATSQGSFLGTPPVEMTDLASARVPKTVNSVPSQAQSQPRSPAPGPEMSLESAVFATFGKDEPQSVDEDNPTNDRMKEAKRWAIELVIWIVGSLILTSLLRLLVFQMFLVPSGSMEETLQVGDRIAALKVTTFQRGDIIVFSDPAHWLATPNQPVNPVRKFFEVIGLFASSDQQYLVKRAIGLPGDHVQCCNAEGQLLVNGVALDESRYLRDPDKAASGVIFDIIVPAGRVFVMGDNRYNSADSRFHLCQNSPDGLGMPAFVPLENIVGPVRAVVMPFGRTGHRALPIDIFGDVPDPTSPAPDLAVISVTGGLREDCHS